MFKLLKTVAQREGYLESAQAEFDALEAKFSNDLGADLRRFRKDIEPYLCDEIIQHSYFEAGAVKQQLVGDPCMKAAYELFDNPERYAQILGKPVP